MRRRDMDADVIFHIRGNPGLQPVFVAHWAKTYNHCYGVWAS